VADRYSARFTPLNQEGLGFFDEMTLP